MAESSRSRVTITLGRSGQVVKRAGPVFNSGYPESQPAIGRKRSVKDRLGVGAVDVNPLTNKRQRENGNRMAANGLHLGKNDLRFKLLQKNGTRQVQGNSQQNGIDLRQTLSRPAQDYKSDISTRQRLPKPLDSRPVLPRKRTEPSTMYDPPPRSTNVLPRMETQRNSHSPWTLDRLIENSPDRVLTTSRTVTPLRNDDEGTKRPLMRPYDDARAVPYMTRETSELRRPLGTSPYMTKPTMAAPSVKLVAPPISRPSLPSGAEHKSSYRVQVDERITVDSFLYSLGLEKYIIPFKAEEVDMATLRQMGERDLKELGIPMGPRKKILLALLPPRSKLPLG